MILLVAVGWVVFAGSVAAISFGVASVTRARGHSLEKSHQSALWLMQRVPVVLLWVGWVLVGGVPTVDTGWGLPGQLLGAAVGNRAALVVVMVKVIGSLIGATRLWLTTVAKGSRL